MPELQIFMKNHQKLTNSTLALKLYFVCDILLHVCIYCDTRWGFPWVPCFSFFWVKVIKMIMNGFIHDIAMNFLRWLNDYERRLRVMKIPQCCLIPSNKNDEHSWRAFHESYHDPHLRAFTGFDYNAFHMYWVSLHRSSMTIHHLLQMNQFC